MEMLNSKQWREKYGPALVVGELYWALPTVDHDDDTGFGNIVQPARFMGYDTTYGHGEERWWWLYSNVEDWPPRWIGDHIPLPEGASGDNPPVR